MAFDFDRAASHAAFIANPVKPVNLTPTFDAVTPSGTRVVHLLGRVTHRTAYQLISNLRARISLLLALLLVGGPFSTFAADPPNYKVTDLGAVFGTDSRALGLSDNGYVVGWSGTTSNHHAIEWFNGVTYDNGTGGGARAQFYSVKDDGGAVGSTLAANGTSYGYAGGPGFPPYTYTDLSGNPYAEWFSVSSRGWFASSFTGQNLKNYGARQAFQPLYPAAQPVEIENATSFTVNERGHFGGKLIGGGSDYAYVWHGNDPLLASGISSIRPSGDPATLGLNDNYQAIVGQAEFGSTYNVWNYRTGATTPINPGTGSMFDINNRAEVVGYTRPGTGGHFSQAMINNCTF